MPPRAPVSGARDTRFAQGEDGEDALDLRVAVDGVVAVLMGGGLLNDALFPSEATVGADAPPRREGDRARLETWL